MSANEANISAKDRKPKSLLRRFGFMPERVVCTPRVPPRSTRHLVKLLLESADLGTGAAANTESLIDFGV